MTTDDLPVPDAYGLRKAAPDPVDVRRSAQAQRISDSLDRYHDHRAAEIRAACKDEDFDFRGPDAYGLRKPACAQKVADAIAEAMQGGGA